MKIAIAKPDMGRYLAMQAQVDLWQRLARDYDCEFTVFADANLKSHDSHLRVKSLHKISGISWLPPYPGLLTGLRGYDLVVTADPTIYGYAWWAALAAMIWRIRLVLDTSVTLLTPLPGSFRERTRLCISKAIFSAAEKILVPTALTARRFVKLGLISEGASKVVDLGHPVDTEVFCPAESGAEGPGVNLLSVGRLEYEKGQHIIIEALAPLLKEGGHRLFLAGDGPYREDLMHLCGRLRVAEKVTFLGMVPRAELPDLYRQCQVFVHHPLTTAEWEEYFGVSVVEAMASGLPVVASDCGAIRYTLPGAAGFLVPQGDVDALRERVQLLLENPACRADMGAVGRAHVYRRYSVHEIARMLYEKVLSNAPARMETASV